MLKINPTRPPAACPPACFAAVEWESVGSLQASRGRRHTRLAQPGLVRLPLSPHRQHVRARCGSEPCLTPHGCVQKHWHIQAAKGTQKYTWIQANKRGTAKRTGHTWTHWHVRTKVDATSTQTHTGVSGHIEKHT